MTNVHSLQWHCTQCLKINLYNCLLKADCLKSAISDLGYFLFVKKLFEYIYHNAYFQVSELVVIISFFFD